ncbi:MAG: dihydropteroate synthase, partial [Deltaproteobacteria bacterium]|nr:dihydropteroate synthase [Deltaproteobacteria bacterium]
MTDHDGSRNPGPTSPASDPSSLYWKVGHSEYRLDFGRPVIMGIVNVTPDSFSDGGLYLDSEAAINLAKRHLAEGAQIIDLGAETTRPGSLPISEEEEWERLLPIL